MEVRYIDAIVVELLEGLGFSTRKSLPPLPRRPMKKKKKRKKIRIAKQMEEKSLETAISDLSQLDAAIVELLKSLGFATLISHDDRPKDFEWSLVQLLSELGFVAHSLPSVRSTREELMVDQLPPRPEKYKLALGGTTEEIPTEKVSVVFQAHENNFLKAERSEAVFEEENALVFRLKALPPAEYDEMELNVLTRSGAWAREVLVGKCVLRVIPTDRDWKKKPFIENYALATRFFAESEISPRQFSNMTMLQQEIKTLPAAFRDRANQFWNKRAENEPVVTGGHLVIAVYSQRMDQTLDEFLSTEQKETEITAAAEGIGKLLAKLDEKKYTHGAMSPSRIMREFPSSTTDADRHEWRVINMDDSSVDWENYNPKVDVYRLFSNLGGDGSKAVFRKKLEDLVDPGPKKASMVRRIGKAIKEVFVAGRAPGIYSDKWSSILKPIREASVAQNIEMVASAKELWETENKKYREKIKGPR